MNFHFLSDFLWWLLTVPAALCSIVLVYTFKVQSAALTNNYIREGFSVLAIALMLLISFYIFTTEAFYFQLGVILVLTFLIGIPAANSKIKKTRPK